MDEDHILLQVGVIRKAHCATICGCCGTASSYPEHVSSEGGGYIAYNTPGDFGTVTPAYMDSFTIKDMDMGVRKLAWFDEDTEERTDL
jgi:hypothetical protein